MAYTQRPGDGSMFANDKKTKDTHPDRTGSALIHCPHCSTNFEVWLSGWLKETPVGKKFLSLSIKSKEDPGAYRGPGKPDTEGRKQHDLSKPRHMPPPPLHQPVKPKPKLDPQDADGNYTWDAQEK